MAVSTFIKICLFCYLIGPFFLPPSIYTLAMLAIVPLLQRRFVSRDLFAVIVPLFLVLLISSLGLFSDYGNYVVFKDFWYLLNPILALLVGGFICLKLRLDEVCLVFVLAGFFVSLIHLSFFVLNPEVLMLGGKEIRELAGKGAVFISFSTALLLWGGRGRMFYINNVGFYTCLVVSLLSISLSYSRVCWLALVLSLVVFFEPYKKPYFIFSVAVIFIFFNIMYFGNLPTDNLLLDKFFNPLSELVQFSSWDIYDIHHNWRGYENYLAFEAFGGAGIINQVLGFGAGFSLPIDVTMLLGGEEHDEIPVLHSAYYHVLLKAGVAGLLLYGFFMLRLVLASIKSGGGEGRGIFILSCLIFIMSFVITGAYNKTQAIPVLVMLGYFLNGQLGKRFRG